MDLPKVLVLLATYNGVAWLSDQLESIFSQRGVDVDVLVSDDCSDDGTAELLLKYERNGCLKILSIGKKFGSAGKNFHNLILGANVSSYDFVAFSDQDDIWDPEKLSRAVDQLGKHMADGYSSVVRAMYEDGKSYLLTQSSRQRELDFLYEGAGQGCSFVMTAGFFIRVQESLNICVEKGLSERFYYHDWFVYIVARVNNYRWCFDDYVCLDYRQHEDNDTGTRRGVRAVIDRLVKIRSGWYFDQVNTAALIAEELGCRENSFRKFKDAHLGKKGGRSRRLIYSYFLMKFSRRRGADRLALAALSLIGWL